MWFIYLSVFPYLTVLNTDVQVKFIHVKHIMNINDYLACCEVIVYLVNN